MKKTIIILLLTALCMAVFTSCDLSGGLVGELFGGLNQGGEYVETDGSDMMLDDPDLPWGTVAVEIQTTPPQEVMTEVFTTQGETGCDCGQCDLDAPAEPKPEQKFSIYCLVAVVNGQEVIDRFYEPGEEETWNYQADVDGSISELIVRGCWYCQEPNALLGYSINGEEIVWDGAFTDRQMREITIRGTAYLNYCDIVIPVCDMEEGENTVVCYARMEGDQGEYVETLIEFAVNRDSLAVTQDTDTVQPAEIPEGNIDG